MATTQYECIMYPPIKSNKTSSKIVIFCIELILFTSARFKVLLYDQDDNVMDIKIIQITGDDYLGWGGDDKYIKDWIITQLQNSQ